MVSSKFTIGQQVRHQLLGHLGVVIDVDAHYSLTTPSIEELDIANQLQTAPWYHVVMEDSDGNPIRTYIAEAQLASELTEEHPEQASLDELAVSIQQQLREPRLCN